MIDGERGRVPFALVGVLLLVGAAVLSAGLGPRRPRPADPARERAVEEATAAARTALRAAAREAGRRAAARPVVERANTTAGRALRRGEVFRDALRLRLYLAAERRFDRIRDRAGPVTATVRLRRPREVAALERARNRTEVARAGPERRALRAGIRNVSVIIRRGGTVVERRRFSPSVVVASPVLFVHDRASTFQRRLRAGATEAGLGRRVTARLYALTWARGYAQFGGAPIENVLASRHVAHATNGALLAEQRRAFGRSDRAGRRAYRRMARRVLARDLLRVAGLRPRTADAVLNATDAVRPGTPIGPPTVDEGTPAHDGTLNVSAAVPATAAFVPFVRRELESVLDRVYGARVRTAATVETLDTRTGGRESPSAAGDWRLVDVRVENRTDVEPRPPAVPEPADGWHVLRTYGRRVERTRVTVRRWTTGDRNVTTRAVETTTRAVTVALVGKHAPSTAVPRRGIEPVHEPGGPLDGPNLAGLERNATARLVAGRGGPDALAARAATGDLDTDPVRVEAARPAGLAEWVADDVARLRARLANASVAVERGALGTFAADPHARLAAALRARSGRLVGGPGSDGRYDGVASKARFAARATYLDRAIGRLRTRARQRRAAREGVDGVLSERGLSVEFLAAARRSAERAVRPREREFAGLGGSTRLSVDAAPPYLAATALDADRIDARVEGEHYGVATRNVNVFSVPYGEVADGVVPAFSGDEVRLRVAARALRGADELAAAPDVDNRTLDARRRAVRAAVEAGLDRVRERARRRLAAAGVGGTAEARRAILRTALAEWPDPAARAIAATNGSAARAIVAVATRRSDALDDRISRARLRASLADAGRGATVPEPTTRRLVALVRDGATWGSRELVADRLARRVSDRVGAVPAGLPLAPVPGYWYATTNLWIVRVQGEYARFTVRADRGPPGAPLAYTRDGSPVRLDVDADGAAELLGRATAVTVEARTAVAVVVPPGGRGVGDVDGDADERSPGWG